MKSSLEHVLAVSVLAFTSGLVLSSCAATAAAPEAIAPAAQIQQIPVVKSKRRLPRALWVWDAAVITNKRKAAELFDFCALKGISVVYLSVGDVFSDQTREATDPKHVTPTLLGQFLDAAHGRKLEVEALDGDPEFALEVHHAEALGILQKALAYNKSASPNQKIDGFQWDTEPYTLDAFKAGGESQKSVLRQYLDGASQLCDAVKASPSLRLGFAIPSFFDDDERTITWNGTTKATAFHLLDTLNALPSSYVVIMAYRDHALGPNGTIEISSGEIDYATKSAPKVKVWIGQETLNPTGDPPSISFFHVGENGLEQALGQTEDAFKTKPALAGLAIHHFESYRVLKAGDPVAPVVVTGPITEPLSILTPKDGAPVTRRADISGTAKPGGGGVKVEIAIRPEGDIWYPQGEVPLSAEGTWSAPANFGNDQTPAGSHFEVRAQLKRADDSVLTERVIKVRRG